MKTRDKCMCLSALANPKILSLFTLETAVNDHCCKRIYLLCLLFRSYIFISICLFKNVIIGKLSLDICFLAYFNDL